ncbi:MAG: hypothetical protein KBC35_02690 [Candidatus Pacebacteria bacterium]|nr:hypothetical protein [Candidatus Paceibacterota bacterium]
MIEKITLRIFWTAMLLCASTALIALWFFDGEDADFFKFIPTFFIIGFASFLIWAPIMVYRFLEKK